jgi:hypothetical protein
MEQYKVCVEDKCFDITLHQGGDPALIAALRALGPEGERIGAKTLLEAYLSKALEHEKLKNQLERIEAQLEGL